MTHDPEVAERLAHGLQETAKVLRSAAKPHMAREIDAAAALIRAQAAEIAAHPAALQKARNVALREVATKLEGGLHVPYPMLADTVRRMIDTPAPPAEPAGDALLERVAVALWREQVSGTPAVQKQRTYESWADADPDLRGKWLRYAGAALAAALGMDEADAVEYVRADLMPGALTKETPDADA